MRIIQIQTNANGAHAYQSVDKLTKLPNGWAVIPDNMETPNLPYGDVEVEEICGHTIIHTIKGAEPIGPKNLLDIIVVSPATGNTLAKCALGITDTSVTMAVKAHLRNNKPVVFAIATNDALGASAKNIGMLHNAKNIYFVPYKQDDPHDKNNSLVCDFSLIPQTVECALNSKQIQPILL